MTPILQTHLPTLPWADPATARLPGMQPCAPGDWLRVDEAYAAQMAERRRLVAVAKGDVYAVVPGSAGAEAALAELVREALRGRAGYRVGDGAITCPDGVRVACAGPPLLWLGQIVQEDLCLLQRDDADTWRLIAALLCFPASWRLSEKIGRPMAAIHDPVAAYGPHMARRVDRLFEALHPDRPLWRMNALRYADPTLHQPRSATAPRGEPGAAAGYVRCERQCLVKLPDRRTVLFSIHTYQVAVGSLTTAERHALDAHLARHHALSEIP